jgi:hypothetical protein
MSTGTFGWEINKIDGRGANMVVPIVKPIILTGIQVSIAMMFLAPTQGASEVYAAGFVFPEQPIFDDTGGHDFFHLDYKGDFGPMQFHDPNGINPHGDCGSYKQDGLFIAILKTYAPASAQQNIQVPHNISVKAGSFLVFHMDHWGVPCDIECDGTFTYESAADLTLKVQQAA